MFPIRCSTWTREDCSCVGPVEEDVEGDSQQRCAVALNSQQTRRLWGVNKPIQKLFVARNPIVASTQTAQVVILYTKTKGKYVAPKQQYRSHFLAHLRGILDGDRGGLRGARVAITVIRALYDDGCWGW